MSPSCVFCKIIAGEIQSHRVYEDERTLVFLDNGPLFPGHCLVTPKQHYVTLMDLPPKMLEPLFTVAQTVCRAVEKGIGAEGSFVAVNNKISQSVPHLHLHVVPRTKGDGLRGFFWPRTKYADDAERTAYADRIRSALG